MRREELLGLAREMARPYRLAPPPERTGGRLGGFAGRRDGHSVDFHDFRQYQAGDDPRRIDWRGYARHGQLHLKLFREEVAPVVEIHVDTSASMAAYPGKEDALLFVAAFLLEVTQAAEGYPVLIANAARHVGNDAARALAAVGFGESASATPADAMPRAGSIRFFLSDFLFPAGLDGLFGRHQAGAARFIPLMFLSASERNPPWRGRYRLHDIEDGTTFQDAVVTDELVASYQRRLRRHRDTVNDFAGRAGESLVEVDTTDAAASRDDLSGLVDRLFTERLVTPR